MTGLSPDARNINWLVASFVQRVPGVSDAIVVSADGLPMAVSEGLDRDGCRPLRGGGLRPDRPGLRRRRPLRRWRRAPDHHRDGARLPLRHGHQRRLAASRWLPTPSCDVGLVGYEMAVLVERAGAVLTPALRAELQGALPA